MIAVDNTNLISGLNTPAVVTTGFAPVVTWAYSSPSITFTDGSSFPSADSFKIINCTVTDNEGNQVTGAINAASGTAVVNCSTLVQTSPWRVNATVVSTNGCISDGGQSGIGPAVTISSGSVGNFTKGQFFSGN